MPELLITCPNEGETVETGITASQKALEETDSYSSDQYIDEYNMLTQCDACGETHVWHAEDAFLEDEQ